MNQVSRASEQAGGAEDEDHDQDREDQRPGPLLTEIRRAERASQSDDQSAEHGSRQLANPAQHGRRERIQPVLKAHLKTDRVDIERVHDARDAAQRAADHERRPDHAIDVNPHQLGRDGILLNRPHRLAELGELHEQRQPHHDRHGDEHDQQVLDRELNRRVSQQVLRRDELRKIHVRRSAPQQSHIHEDERDTDGRHQRSQLRSIAQRLVDDSINGPIESAAKHRHDQKTHHQSDECPAGGGLNPHDPNCAEQRQRQKCPQHEQVAVREVDQPDDAIHHRVTQRDQGDQRTRRQPDQAMLNKLLQRGGTGGIGEEKKRHRLVLVRVIVGCVQSSERTVRVPSF